VLLNARWHKVRGTQGKMDAQVGREDPNRQQSQGRSKMMHYANAIMHVQQVNTTSNSIEHGSFSALSKQLLLDIQTHYNAETTGTITLDCSELESINSHGISLLILLLIYSQRQQKRLQVFGLSEHNQYIFEITRLSKFIDIIGTRTQAVETVHLASKDRVFSQEEPDNDFHSYSN
jgi:anti-anti-sigma regulatory factor